MTKTGTALDPVADFETPVKKQTTLVEESSTPMAVRDDFSLVRFVKPHFERDKGDHPFIAFEVSVPLTDEHRKESVLPEEIFDAWDALVTHELKSVSPSGVDGRSAEFRADPKMTDQGRLVVKFAEIEKVVISVVVEKGTGEEREITRLHFRLSIELNDETLKYAGTYFGKDVWLRMVKTQGKLKL